jgi:hypothetical protein
MGNKKQTLEAADSPTHQRNSSDVRAALNSISPIPPPLCYSHQVAPVAARAGHCLDLTALHQQPLLKQLPRTVPLLLLLKLPLLHFQHKRHIGQDSVRSLSLLHRCCSVLQPTVGCCIAACSQTPGKLLLLLYVRVLL